MPLDLTNWTPEYRSEAYRTELIRRAKLVRRLNQNPEQRALVNKHYKHNPVDWIRDFGMTYDPRNTDPVPKVIPFIMFPKQVEFVHYLHECMDARENGLVEKARDMGASWLCVAFTVWLWIYHPGTAIGWGSRKGELVDNKDDMKAVFPKIRLQIKCLPYWMKPVGYEPGIHATYMKIINPENGATITGEAGDNIGRGGRTSIYFKDESAHYERPESIEASLGDNTDVQIDISSVNGTNNVFYRRRQAGEVWIHGRESTQGRTRVFIFDWKDHPGKTQQWYDLRRARAVSEGLLHIFAQEVERNYSAAVDRLIIHPDWVNAAVDADKVLGFGDDGMKVSAQDVADGGKDKNAQAIMWGVIVKYSEDWGGEAGDAAAPCVTACVQYGVQELYYDAVGVGSGFKTGINNLRENGAIPERLRVFPWNGGTSVQNPEDTIDPMDPESPTNENYFANLKAQSWWRLRTRFYKTFRAIHHGETYDPSELISLPSDLPRLHDLKNQLSQAVHKYDKKGKVMVDKTPEGAASPNLADAVVMCANPTREISILDAL